MKNTRDLLDRCVILLSAYDVVSVYRTIDEVHMLSLTALTHSCKRGEKPPVRSSFLLGDDPQKCPVTLPSFCNFISRRWMSSKFKHHQLVSTHPQQKNNIYAHGCSACNYWRARAAEGNLRCGALPLGSR